MSFITSKEVRKFRLQRPGSPPKSGFTKETNPSLLFVKRHIREPIWYLDSGCSRSMTGVKSYLHKYVEQPGPKVVFGDNSSCITKGYGSINSRNNINANKEIVLIAPRRNDVYVLDMSSLTLNGACFFAKASEILGLPSLVYSKDKPCTTCEKGKHHRASFKTKQNFSIRKCLHLLHMDLFGPVCLMSINHEKYTLVIVDEYSRERIPDISYFHVFGCQVFIHNHKDHLGKFDAKADDGYFLGYSFVSKAFRVFNTRRQQVEETYHVIFDECMEAIRQYQVDSDVSYYIIPHGRSLTELTQENHVPEVIAPNEPDIPYSKDTKGPPNLINTKGTYEQNVQNDQMITQPTDIPSRNNTEVSGSITEYVVPNDNHSNISNLASTSMLTRSMAAKLTSASASECLFADFLCEIEPKKVSEALKHPGWVDAMQ
ncbi:retrovirus-related pol polyprotein from transposon TNT 1-94 [Tanacetum coccineum]